jgi:hypothetical protein
MWEFRHKVRNLVSGMLAQHRPIRRSVGSSADWLPPVLGPNEWSTAMMADRSAGWYFDRN